MQSLSLTSNIDINDKLCNGAIGQIEHFKFDDEGNIKIIYLKMEKDNFGLKAMNADHFGRCNGLVPISRIEKDIKISEKRVSSPVIKRFQFPLMLSWACTVHKVQGKTFSKVVFSFDLLKQTHFKDGQTYTAMSRTTSLEGLFFTGDYNKNT